MSCAISEAGIPVPKFVIEVLATVAVTDPVTAVDTEAIGIVRRAGAPAFAIPARNESLWFVS